MPTYRTYQIHSPVLALMLPDTADPDAVAAAIESCIDAALTLVDGYYGGAVQLVEVDDEAAEALQDD